MIQMEMIKMHLVIIRRKACILQSSLVFYSQGGKKSSSFEMDFWKCTGIFDKVG